MFAGVWADNKDFDSVLISKRMLQDHMPDNVLDALCQVIIKVPSSVGFSWIFNQHTTTTHHPIPPLSNIPTKTNKSWTASNKGVSCCQASQVHAWQSAVSTVNIARNNKYKVCLLLSPLSSLLLTGAERVLTGSMIVCMLFRHSFYQLYSYANEAWSLYINYILNFAL